MTIKEVVMPSLGESVTEASVVNWLVQPGEAIERYQGLMEVVSDKVTTEIPSDFAGIVNEYLVELDTKVPIGTKLMSLEVAGEVAQPHEQAADVPLEKVAVAAGSTPTKGKGAGRYSPAVLRLSQEKGINLAEVQGTGKDGRITRKDIVNWAPAAQAAPEVTDSQPAPLGDVVVPADGIRKAIAQKMVQSTREIPHAWLMVEADVTQLVALRQELKDAFFEKEGYPLSYFPFFVKAVVQALKANPRMNTSWDEGSIVYHQDINLSIAISTPDHLFVPVIHQADNYSVRGLGEAINTLATKVRAGTIASHEMQGGTFTVNNTGSIGAVQSMGIINHPQAAILQVESIVKRVVPTGENGLRVADMVNLSLSIDHRILDGQQAGKFLQDVKDNLARFSTITDIY